MSFYGVVPEGTGGHLITIEAQVNIAAPTKSESLDIRLLGLPQVALKQGVPRWQNALRNSGLTYPKYEVTINLAPADLPKEGTTLEAPIVAILGILGETTEESEKVEDNKDKNPEDFRKVIEEIRLRNQLRRERLKRIYKSDWVIIGELRLSGELKSTRSLLGMISKAPKGAKIIVPIESKHEASILLFKDINAQVFCVSHINEVVNFILGEIKIDPIKNDLKAIINSIPKDQEMKAYTDYSDIVGQDIAKRAIEIAIAGGHSVLLFGPPGEGKTMLAKAIPGIMPNLTTKECFEINQIYSAKGLLKQGQVKIMRPFRQVHTSASLVNILGGRGQSGDIEPGEVSLAHNGVLFLDELPQFPIGYVDQLRAALAEKKIVIGRASGSIEFMCNFALVSAMNPCTCGYYGEYKCSICAKTIWRQNGECEDHPNANTIHKCKCSKGSVDSYLRRLSGPFLDRVDLKVRVYSLNPEQRFASNSGERSKLVRDRIKKARERQTERYKGLPIQVNAELEDTRKYFHLLKLPAADLHEFDKIQGEKNLSMRGAVKVLQVARTIADLEGKQEMSIDHILQALGFMGSTFNEHEIQVEFETTMREGTSEITPIYINHLKEKVLAEIGRRRLSKNRCAKEIDLSILTFNKVMRGETNISQISITKINSWLNESSGKSFSKKH
ncbi:MAG: ATP-binding protein [Candidatus Aminicenantes bacterium]|nr:ATP-binding protein [Candidatus Aminicenantes bacterium]